MKALKTLALGGVLSAAIAASVPAVADDRNEYRRSSFDLGRIVLAAGYNDRYNSRYDRRYDSAERYNRHVDRRHGSQGPVTLRLYYDANGSGRIRLKRMLRDQHGINPDDWRIRSVNIRNKSRRDACADLTVGGRSTGPVYLRKGLTSISAPRSRSDGRWVLDFENAKVRDVAVILEPRHSNRGDRYGKYRPLDRNDAYSSRDERDLRRRGYSSNDYRR